jgi:hypothetical protein
MTQRAATEFVPKRRSGSRPARWRSSFTSPGTSAASGVGAEEGDVSVHETPAAEPSEKAEGGGCQDAAADEDSGE